MPVLYSSCKYGYDISKHLIGLKMKKGEFDKVLCQEMKAKEF